MNARVLPLVFVMAAATVAAQSTVSPDVALTHTPYPNGQSTGLGAQIDSLLAQPSVARAHWGIAVTELDGTPIYGHDEGKVFRPASNNKLFTTAAAMELLKPETTLSTHAWFTLTPADQGEVKGDITLVGAGDANFSDTDFPYRNAAQRKAAAAGQPIAEPDPLRYFDELAQKIAAQGVKRVDGNILGDDTAWVWEPYPESWGVDDLTWGYGAPVSALTAEDNELEIHVTAGARAGDAATFTLKPDLGYYKTEFSVLTVEKGAQNAYDVARDPGSHTLRVYGTIAVGGEDTSHLAIDDPAQFSALALKQALEAHGITVAGKAEARHQRLNDASSSYRASHEPITTWVTNLPVEQNRAFGVVTVAHTSPTVADDVDYTLKVSQNMHAESFLRRLGAMYGKPSHDGDNSTSAQGLRVVRQFLVNAGVDGDDFALFDGSGLSDHDLVAPRAFAQLLAYAQKRPWFQPWFEGLPVGGEDGTLRSRFAKAPLKDHVFAKTGTLGESRALSGYLDCASGKRVIFSIMVDDHMPGGADAAAMDKIVAAIAAAE